MSSLQATVALYREAAADTWFALPRSLWAQAYLLGAFVAFVLLMVLLAPFGIAGGFVLGFIQAGMIGWYLGLLEISVISRRKLRFSDVKDAFGRYFWETISILFLFFIPQILLQISAPHLLLVLVPIASVVFNPAPEMLYQDGTQSTQTLGDALRFMQQNWPEWLVPHLGIGLLLVGWGWAMTGGLHVSWVLKVVQLFGPFFEFIRAGGLALQLGGGGLLDVVTFFGMFALVHAFMLFRGYLYKHLKTSSRRSRAWKARL